MINWAKPILINGVHETFKLAGTLNDKQLVVTTDSMGHQTLFGVNSRTGSSERFASDGLYVGPKFSNEPETITTSTYYNIYSNGEVRGNHKTRESAHTGAEISAKTRGLVRVACLCATVTVTNGGQVAVTNTWEPID
jgi:hypothetical protein